MLVFFMFYFLKYSIKLMVYFVMEVVNCLMYGIVENDLFRLNFINLVLVVGYYFSI